MGILNAIFPASASNFAGRVDALYFFILGVTAFFAHLRHCTSSLGGQNAAVVLRRA